MIWFFGLQFVPLGYGFAYLFHSIAKKRKGQAVTIAVLLLLQLATAGVLLWEFVSMP